MGSRDKRLGMDQAISRRDFLNGVSVAIGASLLPACGSGDPDVEIAAPYYPPAKTGLRGSHPGSFEAAHATVQGQRWERPRAADRYDLVIVGAGISGLAAAYIYRRDVDPGARILVLDNHDDFGGHAKRNEFTLDGRTYIGYGGTMLIEAPGTYSEVSKQVLRELGIDVGRYAEFHHDELFASRGMGTATFLDRETFGADYLLADGDGFGAAIEGAPLSPGAREQLERLLADEEDYLPGMSMDERRAVLETHSWRDYLATYAGIGDEVLAYLQKQPHGYWAIGADALPAWMAWQDGRPGFAGMDLGHAAEAGSEEINFRFPDGNASIARLLVRKLVPGVAPGVSMEDIVSARFDYSALDREQIPTRIRLNSTVVDLRHRDGDLGADVDVTYVNGNEAHTVSAGRVIWAGYHAMLPHVCPDLPAGQAAACRASVRAPLVYTNVLIRNWRSLDALGVQRVYCPGSFFPTVMFGHPVSFGDYRYSLSPDEPVILHLQHVPLAPGLPAPEQFRAGRRFLLETPFETFERNIRDQLGRMLGPGGFDPARDIAGIAVNRWPHGYAYSCDAETGDVAWGPDLWHHDQRPWEEARRRVGNMVFAGTDAASNAMTESAIDEAHRAVHSLLKQASTAAG
ncbi:MAG: NAD(P)/FAD-dependent oxidoreductase [Gammaproteobacteria bacterium]|nr:NAD(P)/FAD-dependent oxidoreductase [Gammaproteobacteria bacterium]MDH4256813.1 NAD(P)/FAD-dependent oxidoreductase [Gammaproteobacteria bacterium]MDH5311711.1 NAD(P)/FAD-dependent oxidoreductase [Gammaproteobacteria bacterium]